MPSKTFLFLSVLSFLILYSAPARAFQTGNMVLIPAGSFSMGDPFNEGTVEELPVHTVTLSAYYIDAYEVTNALYCQYLNSDSNNLVISAGSVKNASGTDEYYDLDSIEAKISWDGTSFVIDGGYENHPVMAAVWYGANAYAAFHGKRLPTEAEWEKAARGGLPGKRYPWGDGLSASDANYNLGVSAEIGGYPPNGYGIYDMAGNAQEWCNDGYQTDYYSVSQATDPQGPEVSTQNRKMIRGGWWNGSSVTCSRRQTHYIYESYNGTGFRCAGSAASFIDGWKEYKER